MKYQKNIPATKPNKVHIPDQKTLIANAKVIMKKRMPRQDAEASPYMVCRITYQRHG